MDKQSSDAIETATEWLREQVEHTDFGELGITLNIHGGSVKRFETKAVISHLSETGRNYDEDKKNAHPRRDGQTREPKQTTSSLS
jgi:hypothetical protein